MITRIRPGFWNVSTEPMINNNVGLCEIQELSRISGTYAKVGFSFFPFLLFFFTILYRFLYFLLFIFLSFSRTRILNRNDLCVENRSGLSLSFRRFAFDHSTH